MGALSYLRKNWLGLVGLAVGVVGIALSMVFYSKSQVSRAPVFLVDPVRMEIINRDRISGAPITVVRHDGRKIERDIYLARLYFWNIGELSIRKPNILESLQVILDDRDGEILDYKILKQTRDVVKGEMKPVDDGPMHNLSVQFNILEQGDGFTAQVTYIGRVDSPIVMRGTIEGVRAPIDDSALRKTQFWKEYGKKALILPMLFAVALITPFFRLLSDIDLKIGNASLRRALRAIAKAFSLLWIVAIAAGMLFVFLVEPFKEAKRKASQNVTQNIPKDLR